VLQPAEYPLYNLAFVGFFILYAVTYIGLRRGYMGRVALLPAVMIYVGTVSIAMQNNIAHAQNALLLITALVVAALLDGERGVLVFMPLHFATLAAGFFLILQNEEVREVPVDTLSAFTLILIASGAIIGLLFLNQRMQRSRQHADEAAASQRRLQLAQLTTRVTRGMSSEAEMDTALNAIVEDILDEFPDMYHVQVFLVDEAGRVARLVASTGAVGQQLLERRHSLPVGSLSVIGQVTQRQEPVVAVVGEEGSVHRPNDLLPDTRLEAALPLSVGGRNIGALDLQSRSPDAITEGDLTALQAVADSIAITINNVRLLEQAQQRLRENQLLVEQATEAQQEVERLNRELTGAIWTDYLTEQRQALNFDLDFQEDKIQSASEFTEAIMDALNRGEITRRNENGTQIVAVPLRVRGEVIGAMEFEVDGNLSSEDVDMLSEVGERLGLAAENTRLYENSQRLAQREALVNEIGSRIQSANSVEATLNEAAYSLRDVLKANRVAIRLGTPTASKGDR
jgi:GAF domain-containing protein